VTPAPETPAPDREKVDYVLVGAVAMDVLGIGCLTDPRVTGLAPQLRARTPGVFRYRSIEEKQRRQL
jgi:hypothetical protein